MSALEEQKAEVPATVTMKEDPETKIAIKQEAVTAGSLENPVANQNGTNGKEVGTIDLTTPIKTEGEASNSENSFLPKSLQLTPTSSAAISSPITPFAPNLGGLSSQLTPEEQTAAYKKANILALSALAKRGGPNTKELFAVQQKLQEFLTSLITLAGQKGPQLKVTVQMLVQNLVTGQISEEEFATRIESDLHSQHQPSLLPFLKNSVPHLKKRLQLQQVIMKELIQRALTEKKAGGGGGATATSTPDTTPASTNPSPASSSPAPSSAPVASSSSEPSLIRAPVTTTPSVTPPPAAQGGVTAVRVGTVKNSSTKPTTVPGSNVHLSNLSSQGPALSRTTLEQLNQQLPQVLRDKIAKLPPEQQKFVYTHHIKTLQMKEQQLKQQQQVKDKQQQLVREQQIPLVLGGAKPGVAALRNTTISVGGGGAQDVKKPSFATMKIIPSSASVGSMSSTAGLSAATATQAGKKKGKAKDSSGTGSQEAEEEEEVGMDLLDEVGVNLQEETAQFLPSGHVESHAPRSCKDVVFLNLPALKQKVEAIMRVNGVQEVGGEEVLVQLSHATQERMRDIVEKLTEISQHRTQTLKDNGSYRVLSEVRSQLRVLETIDRIIGKRKQDREHEQMLRAAKSRSKGADPEKTAKIREEAKQLQQDEAARIRNERANLTALAAIGRKRPLPPSHSSEDAAGGGASSLAGPSDSVGNAATSSLFASLGSTRAPKRHVTSRDVMFYMEQERETRKSLSLYKTMLK